MNHLIEKSFSSKKGLDVETNYSNFLVLEEAFPKKAQRRLTLGKWDIRTDMSFLDTDAISRKAKERPIGYPELYTYIQFHEDFQREFIGTEVGRNLFDFNAINCAVILGIDAELDFLSPEDITRILYSNTIAFRRIFLDCLPLIEAITILECELLPSFNLVHAKVKDMIYLPKAVVGAYNAMKWIYDETRSLHIVNKIVSTALNYPRNLISHSICTCEDLITYLPYDVSAEQRFWTLYDALKVLGSKNSLRDREDIKAISFIPLGNLSDHKLSDFIEMHKNTNAFIDEVADLSGMTFKNGFSIPRVGRKAFEVIAKKRLSRLTKRIEERSFDGDWQYALSSMTLEKENSHFRFTFRDDVTEEEKRILFNNLYFTDLALHLVRSEKLFCSFEVLGLCACHGKDTCELKQYLKRARTLNTRIKKTKSLKRLEYIADNLLENIKQFTSA